MIHRHGSPPILEGLVNRITRPFTVLAGKDDLLVCVAPVLDRYPDFAALVKSGEDEEMRERLRKAEAIDRPIGSSEWLEEIEKRLCHPVRPAKRGPKPKGRKTVK